MQYLIGALAGALFVMAGFFAGRRSVRAERPTADVELTDEEQRQIKLQKERERQWDNMLSYTGKAQVSKDED